MKMVTCSADIMGCSDCLGRDYEKQPYSYRVLKGLFMGSNFFSIYGSLLKTIALDL